MNYTIDARGLACPQPVIKTKKALEDYPGGNILVIVDNPSSRDNVMHMLQGRGYKVSANQQGNDFMIEVEPLNTAAANIPAKQPAPEKSPDVSKSRVTNMVIYLNSDQVGIGDEKLGKILMRGFLQTLKDIDPLPSAIICINSGVFLATLNDETIASLKELENHGIKILACGTCLDFYQLKQKLAVGQVSNMYEILDILSHANAIVSP